MFVVGIALVLSLPILQAENTLTLATTPFDGLVGLTISEGTGGSTSELEATLSSEEVDGVPWDIHVTEMSGTFCFTLRMGPETGDGMLCTESASAEGPSQFIPAQSGGIDRGILVAALPGEIARLELGASDHATLSGHLLELPNHFDADPVILVAFLQPGTDIVSAVARDDSGRRIDVSRIVDQVDAY